MFLSRIFDYQFGNEKFEKPVQHFPLHIVEGNDAGDLSIYFDKLFSFNFEVDFGFVF